MASENTTTAVVSSVETSLTEEPVAEESSLTTADEHASAFQNGLMTVKIPANQAASMFRRRPKPTDTGSVREVIQHNNSIVDLWEKVCLHRRMDTRGELRSADLKMLWNIFYTGFQVTSWDAAQRQAPEALRLNVRFLSDSQKDWWIKFFETATMRDLHLLGRLHVSRGWRLLSEYMNSQDLSQKRDKVYLVADDTPSVESTKVSRKGKEEAVVEPQTGTGAGTVPVSVPGSSDVVPRLTSEVVESWEKRAQKHVKLYRGDETMESMGGWYREKFLEIQKKVMIFLDFDISPDFKTRTRLDLTNADEIVSLFKKNISKHSHTYALEIADLQNELLRRWKKFMVIPILQSYAARGATISQNEIMLMWQTFHYWWMLRHSLTIRQQFVSYTPDEISLWVECLKGGSITNLCKLGRWSVNVGWKCLVDSIADYDADHRLKSIYNNLIGNAATGGSNSSCRGDDDVDDVYGPLRESMENLPEAFERMKQYTIDILSFLHVSSTELADIHQKVTTILTNEITPE